MATRFRFLLAILAVSCTGNGEKGLPCDGVICSGHGLCVVEGGEATCACDPGYRADGADCLADCTGVECSNRGGCTTTDNELHCACGSDYYEVELDCQPAPATCDGVTCSDHGQCQVEGGQPVCVCHNGYAPFGLNCVRSLCAGVDCSGHGTCVVHDGAPSCDCDDGYRDLGLGCVPLDCTQVDCGDNGACATIGGQAQCLCDQGFVAVGDECWPEACERDDCSGHGTCVNGAAALECLCDSGYVAQELTCLPRCADTDCGGHGLCVQTMFRLACLCDPGYEAVYDTCVPLGLPQDGGPDGGDGGVPTDGGADGSVDSGILTDGGPGTDGGDSGGTPDAGGSDSGSDGDLGGDSAVPGAVQWVAIAGGSFEMGSTAAANEQPVHTVTLAAFEMTRSEITVAQYAECVTAGVCDAPGTGQNGNWNDPGYENHPVNYINWSQARAFCEWVGGHLPSEAQWEYAARSGGQDMTYPWGAAAPSCAYAVMSEGTAGCGTGRTMAVCSKTGGNTEQGLCDMGGNLSEWMQDVYQADYDGAPQNGDPWEAGGSQRVIRGGDFSSDSSQLRTTRRSSEHPNANNTWNITARCAR